MKRDNKLFKILINLDIVVASIALVILVGCTLAGAIARYVVGEPFGWIGGIQAAFIVWVVFAAGGTAYRTGDHSTIKILYEIFPKPVRKIVSIFTRLVMTTVLRFLCYASVGCLQLFMRTGRATAVLNLPLTWIYMIVPASCMLQILNYFFVNIFGYEDGIEKLVKEDEDK